MTMCSRSSPKGHQQVLISLTFLPCFTKLVGCKRLEQGWSPQLLNVFLQLPIKAVTGTLGANFQRGRVKIMFSFMVHLPPWSLVSWSTFNPCFMVHLVIYDKSDCKSNVVFDGLYNLDFLLLYIPRQKVPSFIIFYQVAMNIGLHKKCLYLYLIKSPRKKR